MLHVGQGRRNAQNVINQTAVFPTVVDTNTGTDVTSAGTSATVQLPPNIAVGDLLLILAGFDAAISTFAATGWTRISVNAIRAANLYRIADGSEGSSIGVTWTTSATARFVSWRISAATWDGVTAPSAGTAASATNANPNPPTLTPAWGAGNTFWIAMFGSLAPANTITAYPANYTLNQTSRIDGDTTIAHLGVASRNLNAASEDPGTFTITAATYSTYTVAVKGK